MSHDRSAFIILYLLPPTPLFGCGGNALIPQICLKVLYITLITCAELRLIAVGRLEVMMGGRGYLWDILYKIKENGAVFNIEP